jgi:hypothetical protein
MITSVTFQVLFFAAGATALPQPVGTFTPGGGFLSTMGLSLLRTPVLSGRAFLHKRVAFSPARIGVIFRS